MKTFYFLTDFFLNIFSEFYMKPVARGYNLSAHFNNTLYILVFIICYRAIGFLLFVTNYILKYILLTPLIFRQPNNHINLP
jgi:hypothetical protein